MESKFFGIGYESFTVGSNEFYLLYALKNGIIPLMDTGHYHPSEYVYEKISSVGLFFEEIALHFTKSVNWDSDHVVSLNDEIQELTREIVSNNMLNRVRFGLDFFDASINRIAAWVLGTRNLQKALLMALLMPHDHLHRLQNENRVTEVLILLEEFKTLPFHAIWEQFCIECGVVSDASWWEEVSRYENEVLNMRGKE